MVLMVFSILTTQEKNMTTLSSTQPFKVNLSNVEIQNSSEKQENSLPSWSGRSVRVKNFLEGVCSRTINAAQKTFNVAGAFVTDPNALASVFRRLNCQIFNSLEELKKIPLDAYSKFRACTHSFVGVVDTVQVFDDVNYFYTQKYKEDNKIKAASRVALFAADVGGSLLWLQEMTFIKLNRISKTLGEVRLFSFVPKVVSSIPVVRRIPELQHVAVSLGQVRIFSFLNRLSMHFFAGGALTLYYLFSAMDSLRKLSKDSTPFEKKQAGLDLSYQLSEVTLNALMTIGVASVAGLGVLGATCIATGLASFAHKNYK